ncbi:MAG: VanZ family protein [Bacillota bacterium]|nr:VanZ family protein [Bacillota bacterium]
MEIRKYKHHNKRNILPFGIVCILITLFSVMTGNNVLLMAYSVAGAIVALTGTAVPIGVIVDILVNIIHYVLFALLSLSAYGAFNSCRRKKLRATVVIIFICSIGACMSELIQALIPGRSCSAGKILQNLVGILIGIILHYLCIFIKKLFDNIIPPAQPVKLSRFLSKEDFFE